MIRERVHNSFSLMLITRSLDIWSSAPILFLQEQIKDIIAAKWLQAAFDSGNPIAKLHLEHLPRPEHLCAAVL
jgi:hypothetical protein